MAVTVTDLQTLRDALLEARLRGVREVTDQNGEQVRYATDAEMARALADVESRILAMQRGDINQLKFCVSKGT